MTRIEVKKLPAPHNVCIPAEELRQTSGDDIRIRQDIYVHSRRDRVVDHDEEPKFIRETSKPREIKGLKQGVGWEFREQG